MSVTASAYLSVRYFCSAPYLPGTWLVARFKGSTTVAVRGRPPVPQCFWIHALIK